jgi:hypothetical protein
MPEATAVNGAPEGMPCDLVLAVNSIALVKRSCRQISKLIVGAACSRDSGVL